ncbi:ATP-dependent RNA helicase DBP5 [Nosema granulosis]|uniref:RNA helicase n=1 Tax=Nosema granulosis TaxID=83296 RepID=A0A9P6L070_9MICR|nr:ATP-dependent RNA helicase DBP5 [Nosema granulosis]
MKNDSNIQNNIQNDCNIQNDLRVAEELFSLIKRDSIFLTDAIKDNASLVVQKGKMYAEVNDFTEMGLAEELIGILYGLAFNKPSLVQSRLTPTIINGGNIAVQSPSGTGKTIAYLLGVISKVQKGMGPQAVIISPTRELNTQIAQVLEKFTGPLGLSYHLALRGSMSEVIREEIVLGSPGSIIGLCSRDKLDTANIRLVVFDEADLLLDRERMGAQSFRILKLFQRSKKVFISATYNDELKNTLKTYCDELTEMYEARNSKPDEIHLYYIESDYRHKIEAVKALINSLTIGQCIIFVSSKKTAKNLEQILEEDFNTVAILHGDLTSQERDGVVERFKTGESKFLVTTDVFSRGMDIPMVNLIINFDLPYHDKVLLLDTYIHRIGRSGRFGRTGFVVDLINKYELEDYLKIQQALETISKKFTIEALEKIHLKD